MDASANERLAKVEATVSVLQVQVADIRKTLVDIQKTQVDMQKQFSDLSAKMSLVLWVGAAVGILLLGAAWKSLERKNGVAPAPAPAYAPYPPYAAPEFRQWEMETWRDVLSKNSAATLRGSPATCQIHAGLTALAIHSPFALYLPFTMSFPASSFSFRFRIGRNR